MTKERGKPTNQPATKIDREPPRAALNWSKNGILQIEVSGNWDGIVSAARHETVSAAILSHAATIGSHGRKIDAGATDFVLGFVDAMQPKDPAETLLLSQMAATHQATMMLARRLNHVENIPQQDAAERALNKLARTFAVQMDTLKRYRSKGQQTVRVERVTVENGGQAIVGSVDTSGG